MSRNTVDIQTLQVTGVEPEKDGARDRNSASTDKDLDGLRGPNLADRFRGELAKLLGQEVQISYNVGQQGEPGFLRGVVGRAKRDGTVRITPLKTSPDSTVTDRIFPAVDTNGVLRFLPGMGRNPQVEQFPGLSLPRAEHFVAQVGTTPPTPAPSTAPARTAPTAVKLGQEIAKFKGKDAMIIFHREGSYYYLRTKLKASQAGPGQTKQDPSFPESKVYVGTPPQVDAKLFDARLAQIPGQIGLPATTKLQPVPLAKDPDKPADDIHNQLAAHLSKKPLIDSGILYPGQMKSWARLGLTPIAVVDTIPGQAASTVPTPLPPKALTARPLRPDQMTDAMKANRGSNVILVFPSANANEVEIVAGTLKTNTGITGHLKPDLNKNANRYEPTEADKKEVATAFGINPDQVKVITGALASDVLAGRRISIVVNSDKVNFNSTQGSVYGIIPRK